MKVNMPTSDHEVLMREGQTIVSKTNLKGAITYVNRDFIQISGFAESELIGKNHNIVRHPDMPTELFADLWQTMKNGKPWTGIIKNRCKNGDFYWVRADVAPVYKNGALVEYMSVRSKPSRDQIDDAERFYAKLAGNPQFLHEGVPVSFLQRFKRKVLGKIGVAYQLGFIVIGVLLLSLLILLNLAEKGDAIRKLESEIAGLAIINEARNLIEHIPRHRGLSQVLLEGDASVADALEDEKRAVSEAFSKLGLLEQQHRSTLGKQDVLEDIKADWEDLLTQNGNLQNERSFLRHTEIIESIQTWMVSLSVQSLLSSDESYDVNLLAPIISRKVPVMTDKIGQARGLGAGVLASGKITYKQQAQFQSLVAQVNADLQDVNRMLEFLYVHSPESKDRFNMYSWAVQQSTAEFLRDVRELSEGNVDGRSSSDYFVAGSSAIQNGFALFDQASAYLSSILDQKHEELVSNTTRTIALTMLLIFLVCGGLIFTSGAVLAGMRQATQTAQRLCAGDYSSEYKIDSDNEIGRMLAAIKALQITQGFAVEETRRVGDESLCIKQALDACSTNVMLADDQLNITYVNHSATRMFADAQEDIRQEIESFDANALIGSNADIFHKDPSHQRRLVTALEEAFSTDIHIGGHIFRLIATPVFNDRGERIGTAVEWNDHTNGAATPESGN